MRGDAVEKLPYAPNGCELHCAMIVRCEIISFETAQKNLTAFSGVRYIKNTRTKRLYVTAVSYGYKTFKKTVKCTTLRTSPGWCSVGRHLVGTIIFDEVYCYNYNIKTINSTSM